MFCLYLGSLISYRNVFVLQTALQIPFFKWDMSQPSSMFVAGDIIKKILGAFFLGHPVAFWVSEWIIIWFLHSFVLSALSYWVYNNQCKYRSEKKTKKFVFMSQSSGSFYPVRTVLLCLPQFLVCWICLRKIGTDRHTDILAFYTECPRELFTLRCFNHNF